MYVVI